MHGINKAPSVLPSTGIIEAYVTHRGNRFYVTLFVLEKLSVRFLSHKEVRKSEFNVLILRCFDFHEFGGVEI